MRNAEKLTPHPELEPVQPGILTILVGPTASGKTSVLDGLHQRYPHAKRVVSTTSRDRSESEVDGRDYHFVTKEQFKEKIKDGEFLEHENYAGKFYGTKKTDVTPLLYGQDVLWIVNMGRAVDVKDYFRQSFDPQTAQILEDHSHVILIGIPSVKEGAERFAKRGGRGSFRKRIAQDAKVWREHQDIFPQVIINRDGLLEETIETAAQMIEAKRRNTPISK